MKKQKEYEFRALDVDGNFRYGSLITTNDPNVAYIIENEINDINDITDISKYHKINPSTISQYTNKKDKNKNKIYTGDIIVSEFKFEYEPDIFDNGYTKQPFTGYCVGVVDMLSSGVVMTKYILHSNGDEPYNDILISKPKSIPSYRSFVVGNIYKPDSIRAKYKQLYDKLNVKP